MWLTLSAVFGSAFLAATILPFYSEVVLAAAVAEGSVDSLALWTAATVGNVLGAAVNWWLGKYANHWRGRRWFPASEQTMEKAERWFNKYGVWSLLMAWLPVGGDALTVIAGLLRVRLDLFLILVTIGKGARYWAIMAGVDAVMF